MLTDQTKGRNYIVISNEWSRHLVLCFRTYIVICLHCLFMRTRVVFGVRVWTSNMDMIVLVVIITLLGCVVCDSNTGTSTGVVSIWH